MADLRIALITPYLPAPANTGGRIRIYRLARALARTAEVSLYACAGAREAASQRERDELGLYDDVRVRNTDVGLLPPLLAAKRAREACPRALARDLRRDHARAPFHALVVAHCYAAATARALPEVPCVLDEHNVESRYHAEYAASLARPRGVFAPREVALMGAWERAAWAEATVVTCVSDADADVVRAHRGGPVRVVPNGAALGEVAFRLPSARAGSEVLFVGLMSHAPNVAAAVFLAREVMPRVAARAPGARLVLCGRAPSREVRALAGPSVEVTGTVDRVAPYLDRAAVYANALFQGAGSSLKVPEALAAGVPMVSTALGVRGFPLREGEHYARAEDAGAFADAIVAALRDRAALDARARAARGVAEAYDWDAIGARFAGLVAAAARGRGCPP